MGVKIENKNVIALRIGNTPIVKRYIGGNVVYMSGVPEVTDYDLVCTYNVTNITSPTVLLSNADHSELVAMEVDGKQIPLVTSYAFPTTGEHVVKYKLTDSTKITNNHFYQVSALKDVTINYGITSIGNTSFRYNYFSSITLPDSITTIGGSAFEYCTKLTSIDIPDSVTEIGRSAFSEASALKTIRLSKNLSKVNEQVFKNCSSLESLIIPDSVTSIANNQIKSKQLAYLYIGASVNEINTSFMLSGNPNINVVVSEKNTTYDSRGGCNAIIETVANNLKYGFASTVIPDSVTSIASNAFSYNSCPSEIVIPDSVTSLGDYAFYNSNSLEKITIGNGITDLSTVRPFRLCSKLKTIIINNKTAPAISPSTFNDIASNGVLYYPSGSDYSTWLSTDSYYLGYYNWTSVGIEGELEYDDYIVVRDWNGSLGYVVNQEIYQQYLDLGFTVVQSIIFYDAQDKAIESGNYDYYLQSVPDSTVYAKVNLKFHEDLGFDANDKMTIAQVLNGNLADVWEVHIDGYYEPVEDYDIVASIVPYSYNTPTKILGDTDDIEALYIDNRPIDITTEYLFDKLDFYELKIKLKPEVTKVPDSLFSKCDSLTVVIVENENLTEIGKFAFNECTSLENVMIMESPFQLMHTIGKNAFDNCVSLTNVNIPPGVTTIDNNAFYYCKALTALTLPSSLTTIGYQAFSMSDKLANLTIPSGVTSIGDYAFKSCYGITSIAIPDSVTSLGEGAFYQCGAMTSVEIGSGISTIMPRTFEKCVNLTSIVFPANITLVSSLALGNCLKLQSVTCNAPSMIFASDTLYDVYATGSFYYPCSGDYTEALKYVPEAWTIECINDWQGGITPPEEEEPEEPKSLYDVTATVVVTSTTSTTALAKTTSGMSAMYIDGVEIAPTSAYTFSTTGEHTVGYNFTSTSLPSNVYSGCSTITEIVIGDRITSLNSGSSSLVVLQGTFGNMPSLEKVTIGNGITSLNATYGGFTTKSAVSAFGNCPSLREINLGESITAITGPVFMGCEHLSSITIPASVQDMSDYVAGGTLGEYGVFQGCTNLEEVTFEGTTAPSVDVHSFPNGNAGIFYYPCGRDYSAVASKLSSWTDGCTGNIGGDGM